MFQISLDQYELALEDHGLPENLAGYRERAELAEHFESDDRTIPSHCFTAIRHRGDGWPFLVVTQRYAPAGSGFNPGLCLIPETGRLFIGAGCRLLCYDLERPSRLWQDEADTGFWFWSRHGQVVLMSAELELAAWDARGVKLWTRFVEPPWDYQVRGGEIILDVMGMVSRLDLGSGLTIR